MPHHRLCPMPGKPVTLRLKQGGAHAQPQFIPSPMKIIERDALFGAAVIILLNFRVELRLVTHIRIRRTAPYVKVRQSAVTTIADTHLGRSVTRTDLCSGYKFWAVRLAISSLPKSARRNQRMDAEPTALSAWACRQPDNKRSTSAHYAHLKASCAPLPVRRERGRVSQPLTPRV